jgi:hypothetical protein
MLFLGLGLAVAGSAAFLGWHADTEVRGKSGRLGTAAGLACLPLFGPVETADDSPSQSRACLLTCAAVVAGSYAQVVGAPALRTGASHYQAFFSLMTRSNSSNEDVCRIH